MEEEGSWKDVKDVKDVTNVLEKRRWKMEDGRRKKEEGRKLMVSEFFAISNLKSQIV